MQALPPMEGRTATAGRNPTAAGGFEGRCSFGDVTVQVSLDPTLASLWRPAVSQTSERPQIHIALDAREGLRDQVRWFSDEGDDLLIGRACSLRRFADGDGERIEGTSHPTATAVRHALRFGTQPALLRRGWLLVHACALELSDGVHVFAAASGTGKSTLARRAGHPVLADEVVLVAPGRAAAHPALPRSKVSAPKQLAALHFLEQGAPVRREISTAQACARLLSLAMVYERSAEAQALSLALVSRIVESAPAFVTTIPDDDSALDVLRPVTS